MYQFSNPGYSTEHIGTSAFAAAITSRHAQPSPGFTSFSTNTKLSSSFATETLVRPVHFKSINVASTHQSADIKWASPDAVNFMDHLYFITNLVLDYLLESELPQELLNQTLLNDPVTVMVEHRSELIKHFHRVLIAACTCLCIGISIPLFGFMIACCWCTNGSKNSSSKRSSRTSHSRPTSGGRHGSRSRSHQRGESYDTDWLALSARDTTQLDRNISQHRGPVSGSRYQRDIERRHRHRGQHRRSASGSSGNHYRSRSLPPSLKYEASCHPCMRKFFSSNLFVTLLLVSFFAVCTFVTNEYVNNGVKQLPRALNQSMDELQTYLNNTEYEVDNLFRMNFNQLETEINHRLDTSGVIIKHKLAVASEAIALANLSDIVMEFNDTKIRLERLDRELFLLRSRLLAAKTGLTDLRAKIEGCSYESCPLLRKKYANLDNFRIMPQYERLPDIKPLIKKVTQLIDSGIVAQVQRGKDDFDKIGTMIQREVNGTAPDLKMQLSIIGRKLSDVASEIGQSIRWSDRLFNQTRANSKRFDQYSDYERYRHYACLAGASIISFVLLCYTIGWLYGSCRPQPTARTYKTRVRTSASASFPFSCGILTVFLFFLPLILAAIALFMTGLVGDKIVCRVIKHPEQKQSKQIYAMLQNKFLGSNLSVSIPDEDRVTLEKADSGVYKVYKPNYADLIARCHQNLSIYKVLKLDQYDKVYITDDGLGHRISVGLDKSFNLNSTPEFKRINNIDAKLKQMIKKIELDTSRVSLLSKQAEDTLSNSVSISFDDIEMLFARLYDDKVAISPIDIEQLIKDIQTQKASVIPEVESDLTWITVMATSIQDQILPNITSSLLSLKEGVRHLKLRMFHGRNSFGSVINELISKVHNAEKQLKNNGSTLIKISANEFVDELNALIDQYKSHVRNQVENVIGQCEPVSRALNTTTSTLCDDIILPFNGYWLSAVASLILILFATLLAYALKGLYSLARRRVPTHHAYNYTDQEDEISYEDDAEDSALAYHLGHHNHLTSHKQSGSTALPSAPVAADDGWSPTSSSYVANTRPPPYAV